MYFEGLDDAKRAEEPRNLLEQLPGDDIVTPVQALDELYNVLVRKARIPRSAAREGVLGWTATRTVASTSVNTFLAALGLATTHQLAIWEPWHRLLEIALRG